MEGLGCGVDYLNHEMTTKNYGGAGVNSASIIANGKSLVAKVPCTIEEFLVAQGLLPRSVVVEHNGEAVAPSEFSGTTQRR